MVIQRWQTVFLFSAAVAMGIFFFLPVSCMMGYITSILNALVTVLLLVDIFMYRNLKLQKCVALICICFCFLSAAITAYLSSVLDIATNWEVQLVCPVVAIIFTYLAYARMKADEKLLRSYDRIR